MMRSFIKYAFATGVGVFMGSFVVIIFLIAIFGTIVGTVATKGQKPTLASKGFLLVDLNRAFAERSDNVEFNFDGMFDRYQKLGLYEVINALEVAASDDDVMGIYLRLQEPTCGWATLEAIRNALVDFKAESKKKIYAYSYLMSEKSLYLASVADQIYMHEIGGFELNGLSATPSFLKGLLNKLQIEPIIFRVGKYKSPVEPLYLSKMSSENRQQTAELLDDFWSEFVTPVSLSRKIPSTQLERLTNDLVITNPKKALEYKLIDQLVVEADLLAQMRKEIGVNDSKKDILIGLNNYLKQMGDIDEDDQDDQLGVLFIEGVIAFGRSGTGKAGADDLIKEIRKLRYSAAIKGVVLRINSPGGNAIAADMIWAELELLAKKKPVYASFGDIAASGGYYIASAAEKIIASPLTLTGSIGVFGVYFNTGQFFGQKLGITFDRVVTNDYADLGNANRMMSPQEKRAIQGEVNVIYERFLDVVQRGRKYQSPAMLDSVAQGRVWSGKSAKKMGLVDELGGLDDALEMLGKQLELQQYSVKLFPDTNKFEALVRQLGAGNLQNYLSGFLGISTPLLEQGIWALNLAQLKIH